MGQTPFLDWCERVMRSKLEPMKKVARTLRYYQALSLNWFRAKGKISSGVAECFRYNAKFTMKKAYGFRTYDGAKIALYHKLGKLPVTKTRPQNLLTRQLCLSAMELSGGCSYARTSASRDRGRRGGLWVVKAVSVVDSDRRAIERIDPLALLPPRPGVSEPSRTSSRPGGQARGVFTLEEPIVGH